MYVLGGDAIQIAPTTQPTGWQAASNISQTISALGVDVYRASQGLPPIQPVAPTPLPLPEESAGGGTALLVLLLIGGGLAALLLLTGGKGKGKKKKKRKKKRKKGGK